MKHISICICTYKRPDLLLQLLANLDSQETGGLFTYSIVIADNDSLKSAEPVVKAFAGTSAVAVRYCVEPRQGIALARNKVVENTDGDFLAFIDDDEIPAEGWLAALFKICNDGGVDGVLGPVKPLFGEGAPGWVVTGGFYDRPDHPTGFVLDWKRTRTGNVLFKREILRTVNQPFRPELRCSEDQDFFRRMIGNGFKFVWCSEAIVHEVVPPARWKRTVILKRALLRGAMAALDPTLGPAGIAKSVVAVIVYTAALPFAVAVGQRWFMRILSKLCDHLGKLLALAGVNPIKESYVSG
jgi:succinoglycan biosynthesis protein ExoM